MRKILDIYAERKKKLMIKYRRYGYSHKKIIKKSKINLPTIKKEELTKLKAF